MAILKEGNYGGGNNAILIILASTCVVVWIIGLGLICGIIGSLKSPELYQLGLLAFAAGFVGVLIGFVASIPSPMKHGGEKVELEGGLVSETGKWVSSAIVGGSLAAIALEGKNFLIWLAMSLDQNEGVLLLIIVLFSILGFLLMYFTRRIILNIVLAKAQEELKAKLRDIWMVTCWEGKTIGRTPEEIPDEFHEAVQRLASEKIKEPLEEYEGLLAQGIALKLKGDLEGSKDFLIRASKASPTDYRVFAWLGSTHYELEETEKALKNIQIAESLKSKALEPGYLRLYAQVSYACEEYQKAINYYLEYENKYPHDAQARFELAKAYARYGASSKDNEANNNAIEALGAAVERSASLKEAAAEEAKEVGAFSHLVDNKEFKTIAGITREK